jgi:hypothetical protein
MKLTDSAKQWLKDRGAEPVHIQLITFESMPPVKCPVCKQEMQWFYNTMEYWCNPCQRGWEANGTARNIY